MYSEQMMREQGFDDGPAFRVALATDAIWRAGRIILDVRMHRGEVSIEEATDFLVEHTGVRARRTPSPRRGATRTRRRTSCRTCWARCCCSGCARRSERRLGAAFSSRRSTTRCCAAARCRSASTAGAARRRTGRRRERGTVIPAIDVEKGRSRVVFWPGASAGIGAPDRPAGADRRAVRRAGRAADPPRRLRRRPSGAPANLEARRRDRGAGRDAAPARRAASSRPRRSGSRSPPARRGS